MYTACMALLKQNDPETHRSEMRLNIAKMIKETPALGYPEAFAMDLCTVEDIAGLRQYIDDNNLGLFDRGPTAEVTKGMTAILTAPEPQVRNPVLDTLKYRGPSFNPVDFIWTRNFSEPSYDISLGNEAVHYFGEMFAEGQPGCFTELNAPEGFIGSFENGVPILGNYGDIYCFFVYRGTIAYAPGPLHISRNNEMIFQPIRQWTPLKAIPKKILEGVLEHG